MGEINFEARLRELSAMIGSDVGMELFNQSYESLLNDVKVLPGARYWKLTRMKKLLLRQAEYMMKKWIEAKKETTVDEKREIVQ